MKIKMPNGWRTIKSLVHRIRLHGRRGKGMAESFLREKLRQAPQKEGGWKILCVKKNLNAPRPSRVTPAGTSIEVQNEGEENTHTHTHTHKNRLHGRRGKGMAESFLREKLRQAPQKEGGWKILCVKKNLNAPRPSRVVDCCC